MSNRKVNAKSTHGSFFGMQNDERLSRVHWANTKKVINVELVAFKPCKPETLPRVAALLDGFARQRYIDEEEEVNEYFSEEGIIKAVICSNVNASLDTMQLFATKASIREFLSISRVK